MRPHLLLDVNFCPQDTHNSYYWANEAYRLKNTDYFLEFQCCVCYKVNWKITC